MAVYVVITMKPEPYVEAMISSRYAGKHYRYSDVAWVVSTTETATTLAVNIGTKVRGEDGRLTGAVDGNIFVSELTPNYWGFANQALWNWLKEAHEGRT